ncbi:MAG TPA: four helix bundle protein [Terriglobia bacterium]|nr:four helix bundle protein [Terriglobia bacterium]
MEKPPADLGDRILGYSTRIVKVVGSMPRTLAGRRVADQLLTSGLSVGANFEEAQAAESRNDFVHKLQIALKELRESGYWLRLISRAELLPPQRLDALLDESSQLVRMLSKAVARAKGKARD